LMASPIEATILLCDAAQADPSGKVHMLGAGWSITTSPTHPSAIAVLIKVPWDRANQKLTTALTLEDADGKPPAMAALSSEGIIEVGRPPGLDPGTPIDAAFQVTIPSLPLPPGRYTWRLKIAEQEFTASFQVRANLPIELPRPQERPAP
jgi:hypothetical protein